MPAMIKICDKNIRSFVFYAFIRGNAGTNQRISYQRKLKHQSEYDRQHQSQADNVGDAENRLNVRRGKTDAEIDNQRQDKKDAEQNADDEETGRSENNRFYKPAFIVVKRREQKFPYLTRNIGKQISKSKTTAILIWRIKTSIGEK